MTIKDAVEYSQKHIATMHVPTKELYNKVIKHLDSMGYVWYGGIPLDEDRFTFYDDACVKIYEKPDCDKSVTINPYEYHYECGDEIIELIEEEPELTIVIKSDGKKVVTAECNGIKVESHCNTNLDKFSNKEGAHLVISRLFKELNSKSIHKGDIVEVVKAIHCSPEELVGIQGIVTRTDVYEVEGIIRVKFPVAICNCYCWDYSEDELKLVKKGRQP